MSDQWLTENWAQIMGGADELLDDVRHNAAEVDNETIAALLQQAEQQRAATEEALRAFGNQRHALLQTLDDLQRELAVAGHPLRGEVS